MHRLAIVVSTVGYHWEELFQAYWVFRDEGYEIDFYTVNGKAARADPLSLTKTGPLSLLGLGLPRSIAPETSRGKGLVASLNDVKALSSLDPEEMDALYLPGGHGCLFDVNRNSDLHAIIARLYERDCILSGVCHATSTFAYVSVHEKSIVSGHALTGFPHALDKILIKTGMVRREFLPLPLINDDKLKEANANHSVLDEALAIANPRHIKVSLPFITGVGPKSAAPVAHALVEALNNRKVENESRLQNREVQGKPA
ncbi:MAG: hypothetical protein ACOH5I_20955 [Oligoflexus sp.]